MWIRLDPTGFTETECSLRGTASSAELFWNYSDICGSLDEKRLLSWTPDLNLPPTLADGWAGAL